MKAMILAAGRGERMRPLTDETPKPLLKIGERTLIGAHLYRLAEIGITEVLINTSYRATQLKDFLKNGDRFGLRITYSDEGETPLGTAGGIIHALPFFNHEPFLLISADIATTYPLEKLLTQPKEMAHLVLVDNPSWHPDGDFGLDETGHLTQQTINPYTYASFSVWQSDFFENAKSGVQSLDTFIRRAIEAGVATGEYFQDTWYNVGTPEELSLARAAMQ